MGEDMPVPIDPATLAALQSAVLKDPDNVPLRLHLAGLLLESGVEGASLEEYRAVLTRDPANHSALDGAARACDSLGDVGRAASYRELLRGIRSGASPTTGGSQPTDSHAGQEDAGKVRVPAGEDAKEDEWWEFETTDVRLADVGGMEDVKRRLHLSF